jgi:hypothetical protein
MKNYSVKMSRFYECCLPLDIWKEISYLLPLNRLKTVCKTFDSLYDEEYIYNGKLICPICYKKINKLYCEDLECGHCYCKDCIVTWWNTCRRCECPYCGWSANKDKRKTSIQMENLLYKFIRSCGLRDITTENIIKVMTTCLRGNGSAFNSWRWLSPRMMLLLREPDIKTFIDNALMVLLDRKFIRQIGHNKYEPT